VRALEDRILPRLTLRQAAALAWIAAQACATYDGLSTGRASGVGGTTAGAAGRAGSTGGAGNGGGGGSAGVNQGGNGDVAGNSGSSVSGLGGAEPQAGGTSNAGEAGSPGAAAGSAGDAGMAGAGGGAAECSSPAPDVSCACEVHGAHDYWFCATYLSFSAGENKCKSVGMHLPKLETQAEDDWLFSTAASRSFGEYYLGSTDAATPDEWSWLAGGKFWSGVADGTALAYTHWSANEPNASGDCLVVQANGPWDDRGCTDQRLYVCEAL
jgi:hypothetical protein